MRSIDRLNEKLWTKQSVQGKAAATFTPFAAENFWMGFCFKKKEGTSKRSIWPRDANRKRGQRISIDDATFNEEILNEFEKLWETPRPRDC